MPIPLLTDELKARLPELYSQEDVRDPTVQVLLAAANGWLWALTEYSDAAPDGYPHLAFGKVFGHEAELGYVPMDELDEVAADGSVWLVEGFQPMPLSVLEDGLGMVRVLAAAAAPDSGCIIIQL